MDNNKNLHFKILSCKFKVRDFFNPPIKILKDIGKKKDNAYLVLDADLEAFVWQLPDWSAIPARFMHLILIR